MLHRLRTAIGSVLLLAAVIGATPAAAGPWQCVTFARAFSGVDIFGDAATWWQQAAGRYEEGAAPRVGGVLVFKAQGRLRVGHVATVSEIVSAREIKVTHANWSPIGGSRGQVENDVSVIDTSDAGDWSRVRVWYGPSHDIGKTDYAVFGFIYGSRDAAPTTTYAVTEVEAMPIQLAGL